MSGNPRTKIPIHSRRGYVSAKKFAELWAALVDALKARDPNAFYSTNGTDCLDLPLEELRSELEKVSVETKP